MIQNVGIVGLYENHNCEVRGTQCAQVAIDAYLHTAHRKDLLWTISLAFTRKKRKRKKRKRMSVEQAETHSPPYRVLLYFTAGTLGEVPALRCEYA
jgi:hypothetical protein